MKKPTIKGYIAILIAIMSAIGVALAIFGDGVMTAEEAKQLGESITKVVETVQVETADAPSGGVDADAQPATPEAQP